MPWDSVPWFVEGAAEHSSEVTRLLAYAAFGGAEGVIGASDLRVQALASPAAAVRITTGACAITNRAAGAPYQSYAARLPTADQIAVAATGVAARSDLVVARIENPYSQGENWPMPTDPKAGPYVYTRIVSGVANTVTDVRQVRPGDSAITLARIDLPPNTSSVTSAMITDLREMVQPRRSRRLYPVYPGQSSDLSAKGGWYDWPAAARVNVTIPRWATRVKLMTTVSSLGLYGGNVLATMQHFIADAWGNTEIAIDDDQPGNRRITAVIAGTVNLPPYLRGTTQPLFLKVWVNPTHAGNLQVGPGSAIIHDIEFEEAPELDGGA